MQLEGSDPQDQEVKPDDPDEQVEPDDEPDHQENEDDPGKEDQPELSGEGGEGRTESEPEGVRQEPDSQVQQVQPDQQSEEQDCPDQLGKSEEAKEEGGNDQHGTVEQSGGEVKGEEEGMDVDDSATPTEGDASGTGVVGGAEQPRSEKRQETSVETEAIAMGAEQALVQDVNEPPPLMETSDVPRPLMEAMDKPQPVVERHAEPHPLIEKPRPLMDVKLPQTTSDYYSASDTMKEESEVSMAMENNDQNAATTANSADTAKEVSAVLLW